jgi:hypothetical protein
MLVFGMQMRALAPLVCLALCAALAGPASAASPRPERPSVLVALLLPLKGHTEVGTVRFTRTAVSGSVRQAEPGKPYRLALSSFGCRFLEGDPDQPIVVGSVRIHAEKNQDIEVENDETHVVGHDRVRSAVLLGRGGSVRACGKATETHRGAIAAVDARGTTVLAAAAGKHLRALARCDSRDACRLMEEEGIFYYARQPCGKPSAAGNDGAAISSGRTRRRGKGFVTDLVIDPFRRARSFHIEIDGASAGCGALRR